ncbi:hypothetical protein ACC728_37725, partial [Rhizobium ruizarguesonis]
MLRVTTVEIYVLEGWLKMRKSVSFISMLLAFVAMAGEGHAAISYQLVDGAPGRGLVINGVYSSTSCIGSSENSNTPFI